MLLKQFCEFTRYNVIQTSFRFSYSPLFHLKVRIRPNLDYVLSDYPYILLSFLSKQTIGQPALVNTRNQLAFIRLLMEKQTRLKIPVKVRWGKYCRFFYRVYCKQLFRAIRQNAHCSFSSQVFEQNIIFHIFFQIQFMKLGGFPIEIKTEIRYHIICCYHNFIR